MFAKARSLLCDVCKGFDVSRAYDNSNLELIHDVYSYGGVPDSHGSVPTIYSQDGY